MPNGQYTGTIGLPLTAHWLHCTGDNTIGIETSQLLRVTISTPLPPLEPQLEVEALPAGRGLRRKFWSFTMGQEENRTLENRAFTPPPEGAYYWIVIKEVFMGVGKEVLAFWKSGKFFVMENEKLEQYLEKDSRIRVVERVRHWSERSG